LAEHWASNAWGYLASFSVVVGFAWLLSLPQKWRLVEEAPGRLSNLDGLRGLLSYAVFAHHFVISTQYAQTGRWAEPPTNMYTLFGHLPVAVFFQLTAFLFWRKVLDADGPLDYGRLIAGRVRRLTPAYVLAVVATLLVIAIETKFKLQVPVSTLGHQVAAWFSFGFVWPFPMPTNGFMHAGVVNSVLWTLAYEWRFYLLLPLFALFRSPLGFRFLLFGILYLWPDIASGHVVVNFAFGMIAARLSQLVPAQLPRSATLLLDAVALGALLAVFKTQSQGYDWGATLLVAVFMHAIALGGSLFGLLHLRGMRALGTISYSTYLLHNVVLFVAMWPLHDRIASGSLGPVRLLAVMTLLGLFVVCVALVSYWCTEAPFLRLAPASKPALATRSPSAKPSDPAAGSTAGARTVSGSGERV
jgi:peptidoglycan/LPS O-acetylase OafA/YrhL